MGYIQKTWINPISINATELNRIEKGIKNSHEVLAIHSGEISNLQSKQLDTEKNIKALLKDSPNILKTITELQALISNNTSILDALKDTSNFATKNELTSLSNSFLHIKSIKQDGKDIFNNGHVDITSQKVDTFLNNTSLNAISNKAVSKALEELTATIVIPTRLSDLKEDSEHQLITSSERELWNSIKNVTVTETDPTVPLWAKAPNKPSYEWGEILNKPAINRLISEFPDANNYSTVSHTHSAYSLTNHTHDIYALKDHTHIGYANSTHTHTEFTKMLDADTVNSLIDTAINNLIDGASDSYNTLKELETELKNNDNAISSLISQIATKADTSTITSLTAMINLKADKATLDSLTTTVENKVDRSEIDILSNTKADKSDIDLVYQALNNKIIIRRWG